MICRKKCRIASRGDGVCELYLSDDKSVALIDEGDACTVEPYRWHRSTNTSSTTSYAKARVTDRQVGTFLHRLILCFPVLSVDHMNRDGLDNRRQNLRFATHQQNCLNIRNRLNKTSKFRGVFKSGGRWCAQIRIYGRLATIGFFEDEIEAAKAWDVAAYHARGERAVLNFPEVFGCKV